MKRIAIATPALLIFSCAERTPTHAARPADVTKRPTGAVDTSMGRQVQNAIDAGEGDLAARRLRERMSASPNDAGLRLELAEHYRQRGQAELAVEHCRLVLDREPSNARAVLALSRALHQQGEPDRAAETVDQFLQKNPASDAKLAAWLGYLRDDLGETAKAESAHRLAVSLAPGDAKLRNNLGYNLLEQAKNEDAIAEFRKALELEPNLGVAHGNLATALMKAGDRQGALKHWQVATSDAAAAHNNAAVALMEEGRYAESRQELEAALGLKRNYLPAMRNLAILAERDGAPAALPAPVAARSAGQPSGKRGGVRKFWDFLIGASPAQPQQAQTNLGVRSE